MSKNVVETEGPQMTSQYGAYALRAGLARLYARTCMHTPTRPGTNIHARLSNHAHIHTHQYVILIVFPQQQWFRERVTMLRYRYIACLDSPDDASRVVSLSHWTRSSAACCVFQVFRIVSKP
jgi:hypothetical protein